MLVNNQFKKLTARALTQKYRVYNDLQTKTSF